MIEHILVAGVHPERADELTRALAGFCAEVLVELPTIVRCTSGPNFNPRSLAQGHTHGLYALIPDDETLQRYLSCERHQALVQHLDELGAVRFALDFRAEGLGTGAFSQ
ncbi:Dabb family protein [Devosia sp. RR2S18]|uniref:Dabb family protein n=1 Tax=Devosia rhizosphaerae TaxID=3049774 RepID=UPI002540E78A|nr:Dabb family protein [Devosia sp. RR2S18]WIJ25068.1 Dabb family protein [Devosia sp. RR2S18]